MKSNLYVAIMVLLVLATAGALLLKAPPAVEGFLLAGMIFVLVFDEHCEKGWAKANQGIFTCSSTISILVSCVVLLLSLTFLPVDTQNFAWFTLLFVGVIGVAFSALVLAISIVKTEVKA